MLPPPSLWAWHSHHWQRSHPSAAGLGAALPLPPAGHSCHRKKDPLRAPQLELAHRGFFPGCRSASGLTPALVPMSQTRQPERAVPRYPEPIPCSDRPYRPGADRPARRAARRIGWHLGQAGIYLSRWGLLVRARSAAQLAHQALDPVRPVQYLEVAGLRSPLRHVHHAVH
ncbi:hypothetical protein D3C80_982410 [compost metagenome]